MDSSEGHVYGHDVTTEDAALSAHAKTVITIAVVAAILTSTLWLQTRTPGSLALRQKVGLVLAILGFVGWAAARIQLSRSFSIRAKATELVTMGIYSKIRNPVYVFGTLYTVGLVLCVGQPSWLLAFFVIVPMQVLRARQEAQVLEEKFGDAYRAYRAKAWF